LKADIQKYCLRNIFVLLTVGVLTACGGGGAGDESSGGTQGASPTYAEAFRFLNQASMGATQAEARRVVDMGYEAWIDEQMQMPASLSAPYVNAGFELTGDVVRGSRVGAWVNNAVNGRDQLRQRVALALSEILVVSDTGNNIKYYKWELSLADYYDLLSQHAFGNYRDLLEEVTLHPAMGNYLSMRGNLKPDVEQNIRPDENYARELMQLFSIGLVELNIDGSEKKQIKNSRERSIPTYTQKIVEGFAHVYTGWNYIKRSDDPPAIFPTHISRRQPMVLYAHRHDTGRKKLLNGVVLRARENGEMDLRDALDNIFQHSNVAPFISFRLIQRLVTSNPSPAYVARVASVFNNNGSGVKGDFAAVVKAILLDSEARPATYSPIDGKLKEPMLRLTQLWRAYDVVTADSSGAFIVEDMTKKIGQGPLQAASVFNFFLPSYMPPGELRAQQLVAPEMQLTTESQAAIFTSYLYSQTQNWNTLTEADAIKGAADFLINFDADLVLEPDPNAVIDRVARKLLGGRISYELRTETAKVLASIPVEEEGKRTATAIFLIVSSPEFAYQY
jgi:uncharacterized protein (DUF1800 family)